jgi:DNA polymerase-1
VAIKNYGLITSIEELADFADRVHDSEAIGFDIETGYDGPDIEKGAIHPETAKVVGISFTDSTDWARYVPLAHDEGENLDNQLAAKIFWELLSTGKGVAHNAIFELRHLSRWFRKHLWDDPDYGEQVRASNGYFPIRSDTLVEAYLAAEFQRFGLKVLTKELFDHQMTELHELFPDLAKNKRKFLRFNTLPLTPQVVEYACEDSVWCLAIHRRYYAKVKEHFSLLYRVEKAIVQDVVPDMEDYGVLYDWATMRRTADRLRTFRDKFNAEIMTELSALVGHPVAVNLASPPQIADVLFNKLGYRTSVYTDKTRDLPPSERKMSTGKIALERLAQDYPVVQKIRQWKQMTRLLGTYLDKYEGLYGYADDGRTHPNHLSAFVVTGRFAVADPPYQQSPKKYHYDLAEAKAAHAAGEDPPPGTCFTFNFRDCITAPPEHYGLGFDLSQAELRAIAGEAQETALLEAFANNEDVHRLTAALMLGIMLALVTDEQRGIGKTMNFALLYGMGVKSLADRLGIPIEEAQALMDKYFAGFANIASWGEKQIQHGKTYGYVTSKFGRKLPIWEYQSDKRWIYQKGDRACVNYPIQGAATGDYMKIAMVRAVAAIKQAGLSDKIQLVMNIHDALEFYVHQSVKPQDAIALLRPAVVFEVPGWPAMKADWHIFRKWGSPTELDVRDDGEIYVAGQRLIEKPEITEDEDGDEVYELPEVDRATISEITAGSRQRRLSMTMSEMPTQQSWARFVALLDELPGTTLLRVQTPEGEISLPYAVGLAPEHVGAVSAVLGPVQLHYEADAADTSTVAAGLKL